MRRRRSRRYPSPDRQRNGQEGWVYVFSNRSLAGILKIGRTSGDLQTRAAELHGTGVPTPFRPEVGLWVNDCVTLERWMHGYLARDRVHKGREFFRTSLGDVVSALLVGVRANGLVWDRDHDPKGLLPGARERWAAEAAARAEIDRRAKVEVAEAVRRAGIEGELKQAIRDAQRPTELIRTRVSLGVGALLVTASLWVVATAYQAGGRGWLLVVLGGGLLWLLRKIWTPLADLFFKTFCNSTSLMLREQLKINEARSVADEALATGSPSIARHLENLSHTTILPCAGCGVGLRVAADRKGLVRCPKCGVREYYDTRR